MTISYAEAIAQCAEHIAEHDAHGYSQPNRNGHGVESLTFSDGTPYGIHWGDYDCSEMARTCAETAGLVSPSTHMWTGNEDAVLKAAGFKEVALRNKRRGDILWKTGHTGIYLGGGMMADAHGDEWGGITGPREGDQTGREIEVRPVSSCSWERCYRPPAGEFGVEARLEPSIERGVDVSNWHGADGAAAIAGTACGFAIAKASEGTDFVDKFAKANADAAHAAGKLLGFFHYAGTGDARAEAAHFVECCKATGHLAEATLWLDYEGDAMGNGPAWAEAFMSEVDRLTGKTCGFYSYKSCLNSQDFSASAHRPLWGAQYATDDPVYGWQASPWTDGKPWGAWGDRVAVHQYTGEGHVPGYGGKLDLDRGYFTAEQWGAWASGATPEPRPAPSQGEGGEKPSDAPTTGEKGYDDMTPTTFTFTATVRIRKAPSLSAEALEGLYHPGDTVVLDGLAYGDGYVWGHYIGKDSGQDRYVALGRPSYVRGA